MGSDPFDTSALGQAQQTAPASQQALVDQYCVTCHNDRLKTGGLCRSTALTLDRVGADAETWEKVVRKVRAGLMPPAGARRPPRAIARRVRRLPSRTPSTAPLQRDPNPGRTPLHRMNRVEYANAIRDLLSLDVDASTLLPADDSSHGFDNIADVLGVSPSLLERYVSAAAKISRLAVGERDAAPAQVTYTVKGDLSQNQTLDGQPLGTRGGTIVRHNFPVDGEYLIRLSLLKLSFGQVFGEGAEGEELEVTLNGQRVKLFKLDEVPMFFMRESPGLSSAQAAADRSARGAGEDDTRHPPRVPDEGEGRSADDRRGVPAEEFCRERGSRSPAVRRAPTTSSSACSTATRRLPHLSRVVITGTVQPDGPRRHAQPAARVRVSVPSLARRERRRPAPARSSPRSCAERFDARPATPTSTRSSASTSRSATRRGNFEAGIEMALRRILADPEFIFRFEPPPAGVVPGSAVSHQRH